MDVALRWAVAGDLDWGVVAGGSGSRCDSSIGGDTWRLCGCWKLVHAAATGGEPRAFATLGLACRRRGRWHLGWFVFRLGAGNGLVCLSPAVSNAGDSRNVVGLFRDYHLDSYRGSRTGWRIDWRCVGICIARRATGFPWHLGRAKISPVVRVGRKTFCVCYLVRDRGLDYCQIGRATCAYFCESRPLTRTDLRCWPVPGPD